MEESNMEKEKWILWDPILIYQGSVRDCNYFKILPMHNFQWTQVLHTWIREGELTPPLMESVNNPILFHSDGYQIQLLGWMQILTIGPAEITALSSIYFQNSLISPRLNRKLGKEWIPKCFCHLFFKWMTTGCSGNLMLKNRDIFLWMQKVYLHSVLNISEQSCRSKTDSGWNNWPIHCVSYS